MKNIILVVAKINVWELDFVYLKNEFKGKYDVEYDECKNRECSIFNALIKRIRSEEICNYKLLAENFNRSTWVKYSLNEKKLLLRGLATHIGNAMRLQCVPFVHLVEMGDHVYGALDTDYYVIRVNKKYIEDGECMVSTVIFELARAFQLQLIKEVADIEFLCHKLDRSCDEFDKKVSTFLTIPEEKFICEPLREVQVSPNGLTSKQYVNKLIEFNSINIELIIINLMFDKVTEMQEVRFSNYLTDNM
ncbi:hypothetical protein [Bacillus bombysepticus]|uniref:hypothetical protein n=1 Tax=Bacillus bombysepticus TaxID=658666 RepID=UPI003016C600